MPGPQVPHKQLTSIKNYDDDDNPSNSSCVLLLGGMSSSLSHSNRPINAAVPNHNDHDALILTVPAPVLSSNIMTSMLSTRSLNSNTTPIICDHDMDYDYHYDQRQSP